MSIEHNPPTSGPAPVRKEGKPASPLHQDALHESGLRHTTGEALYVDDLPQPPGLLVGLVVASPHAHARITRRDGSAAKKTPGVRGVYFAADIPGENEVGTVVHDEPLLATGDVRCVGQSVALIVGDTYAACREAAKKVEVEYEPLPAILTMQEAVAQGSFLADPHVIARGDVDAALAASSLRLSGEVENGGQDHFYLETHVSLAVPEEGGCVKLYSSTQHPSEVQATVAHVLGIARHRVTVRSPRMGGGFGGKETQGAPWAALAALKFLRARERGPQSRARRADVVGKQRLGERGGVERTQVADFFADAAGDHLGGERVRADQAGRAVLLGRADRDDDPGLGLEILLDELPRLELKLHGTTLLRV